MLEFSEPPLEMGITSYMDLAQLWKSCSSCAGFALNWGQGFSSLAV